MQIQAVPFAYSVAFVSLAAGARDSATISLAGDSDFELHKLCGYTPATDWTTNIGDTGSGRFMIQAEAHGANVWGTAQRPFILAVPWVFVRGGGIQVDVQNLDGSARTFRLTLWGIKRLVSAV